MLHCVSYFTEYQPDMGCEQSIAFVPNTDAPGQTEDMVQVLKTLGFKSRDVDKIYEVFTKMDFDDSGIIQAT